MRQAKDYEFRHSELMKQFQIKCSKKLRFFRTSIYKPETIINAFGRIFELIIPEVANSEFVDGKTIGVIEESLMVETPIQKKQPEIVASSSIGSITPKMAGNPEVLSQLQQLMKNAVKTTSDTVTTEKTYLNKAATEESLTDQLIEVPERRDTFTSQIKTSEKEGDPTITHLVDYYRISSSEAFDLTKSGWSDIFETAVTSGVQVPLALDVLLKYVPFIRESQGDEKYRLITQSKLMELFSVILKGHIKEENIVKCMVLATEKPNLTIEAIISKYLTPKGISIKKRIEEEKKTKESKLVHLDVPVEAESSAGIILLPSTRGIGFKADLVDEGLNVELTFHMQNPTGGRELIGSSAVSASISTEELLYLLAYEMNMTNLGVFEDGVSSMFFAAKIIHESIRQLKAQVLTSTTEVRTKAVRNELGYLTNTVNLIIPLEIEVEGDYFLIPDSEKVYFSLESAKKGFILSFLQRGFPIGQAHISETITQHQVQRLLKEAMLIPINSEGSIEFAGRIILAAIENFLEQGTFTDQKGVVLPQKDDETSKELLEYLNLLSNE
ncbi:MAG: hypothetical protein ACW99Q_19825 [Candidatus Kariarchaeaceae archaeon]